MEFRKVSITKSGVRLESVVVDGLGASKEEKFRCPKKPLASFVSALQAFQSFANDLLDIPKVLHDKLVVTTVNLSDHDGRRGIQVSLNYPVAKCAGAVTSMTTPIVFEPADDSPGNKVFTLNELHLDMIETLEAEATRYHSGEYAKPEQTDMSENTKEFNERAAAAEGATTKRPRGKKGKGGTEDGVVGTIQNPEPGPPPTDDAIRQLLGSVERDVPVDAIARWTSSDRDAAVHWATMRTKELLNDLKKGEKMPAEPPCVLRDATMPLTAENWTEPPVHVDDNAAQEIKAAAEAGVDATAEVTV